jgi:predicted amidohydrolase YtcJ
MTADRRPLLLEGGIVFTAEPGASAGAASLAIDGERIVDVGDVDRVRAAVRSDADTFDCSGCTVLPGFVDAHNHFLATGEDLRSVDARYPGVATPDDLIRLIADAAETTPPDRAITAVGMDHAKFPEGRAPTRWDLDRAAPDHDVFVHHISGHYVLVNSRVLASKGVGDHVADPPGGTVVRDEAGRPTGLFLDAATRLVMTSAVDIGHHGPDFHVSRPLEELLDDLDLATSTYHEAGLTTVCDPQVTARELVAYREARLQGRLRMRTACMPLSHALDDLLRVGLAGPFGDDLLRLTGIKFYADGSLIGGTAAFFEPYGEGGEFTGSLYWTEEELSDMVGRAHAGGWQVGVHAQGDRAIGMVIDAIDHALHRIPRDARHRIEHAGYPTPEQIRRMADLGIAAICQPMYLFDSGDEFLTRLGARAHRLQPLREFLEAGVPVVLSSDAFVASFRPLDAIAEAVSRQTRNGEEIGGGQALTVEEAVRAHTIEAARAIWAEDRIGSLSPGKLADVVVLDGDLFSVPPERIAELEIRTTILGGEVVHGSGEAVSASPPPSGG